MIQTALFFILGFLCAGFLALLVAPAIWRRAVALTRRRVEGSLPLTMNEIQADKDRLRSEFAVSTRQLEITIKSLKDKLAAHLLADGRDKEELSGLSALLIDKDSEIAKAEAEISEQGSVIARQDEKEKALASEIATLKDRLKAQADEIEKLGRMYDDASFTSSARQIELVSHEAKIERLDDDISLLREERKEAQRRVREAEVESKSLTSGLKDEHRKVVSLENKLAQLTSALADREDKLERREQEIARLRGGKALSAADAGVEKRLEERLTQLTRENKKLRSSLEGKRPAADNETTVLREQIGELAAEMVHLTAKLEGPDSPIHKALDGAGEGSKTAQPSLADRIRALRDSL